MAGFAGETLDGVCDWSDGHGNHGAEVCSQHRISTQTICVSDLFDTSPEKLTLGIAGCFGHQDGPKRKLLVVMDGWLTESKRDRVRDYFEWCKTEGLLHDYALVTLVISEAEKTFDRVAALIKIASQSKLKRRDLFVAVGGAAVSDIVGFAAAVYRRSTPWILVPTSPTITTHGNDTLYLHHVDHNGTLHKARLGLRHHPRAVFYDSTFCDALLIPGPCRTFSEGIHEQIVLQNTRYHVALTPELFSPSNNTLIQGYCINRTDKHKRKVLVVADNYPGNIITGIDDYFSKYGAMIDKYDVLSIHVVSGGKDMSEVKRVINAAIDLGLSQQDLFVVVGGGTLMDIVGFAAQMYHGGTPYLRIPTTLIGIIDAGVGVKVGVNFGTHKNLIGGYYAPVACLNDPETFLIQLPRREFACGLAESIKMALLKSDRLFEVIERYHRALEYNAYTHELIHISIRTMLEELQPNLQEHDLRRLVDFGHEFGHIVESLARYELPHGECVAVGMAISSYLAHMNGILPLHELERILNCILDLGLPIHATTHGCCDPDALWSKISTEGIEHKDGMLWLAIPQAIGRGGFLDHITDINADMLRETLLGLEQYAGQHAQANADEEKVTADPGKLFDRSSLPHSIASSIIDCRDFFSFTATGTSVSSDTEFSETRLSPPSGYCQVSRKIGVLDSQGSPEVCEMEGISCVDDHMRATVGVVDTSTAALAQIRSSVTARMSTQTDAEETPKSLNQVEFDTQPVTSPYRTPGSTYVIVADVGATFLRIGVANPRGALIGEPTRILSPGKHTYPEDTLAELQDRLLDTLALEISAVRLDYDDLPLVEVGVSFGAVITHEGIVDDASVLWNDSAQGYDFKSALQDRMPGFHLTILNDVSAAAWRYKDHGRFCLVTVSSGLSNKVFNPNLRSLDQLDLDVAGVGGEMGHVVVEPRLVDRTVLNARSAMMAQADEFKGSRLCAHTDGDAQKISARHLGLAAREGDRLALRLLEESETPLCPCGNLADLCSFSSGRAVLRYARTLATRNDYGVLASEVNDNWLEWAVENSHPLALKVIQDSTYPLALRILQLAADIGLDKFIIVGGFALKIGRHVYLRALQDHLARFCHYSAFFADWDEDKIRNLVRFGINDDNDGLIGMAYFVQHLRMHFSAVEKPIGEQALKIVSRRIPRCGAQEVLTRVVFAGICTTDLQILRGERGHEPTVPGHEGVCHVIQVGDEVNGINVGDMVVLNPNNPLDDHDKLGHTKEGMLQLYMKFGRESLLREQVLNLGTSAPSTTDTLVEPLSCVVAAQERIRDRIPGKNVLVIGAGLMGLMFTTMNTKMGARNVFLTNRSKERLEFAVARGIVREDRVFTIGDDISSQVSEITAGEGIDIAIISVSLGQGVSAAQNAMEYVNAGGCIYLFAGFRPGDVLSADSGAVEAWPIRTNWKTETVHVAGKPVDLSGHRGSRGPDLAMAAGIIRGDSLSFSRIISHVITLDAVPEVMLGLARDGNVKGVPAKRVVIDMATRGSLIELPEEFPLRQLREAARRQRDAIPMGNVFREIGFDGSKSMLGWVHPPAWYHVKTMVESATRLRSLTSKRHFIWIGTGSWGFLVDALRDVMLFPESVRFHVLQSLDPAALSNLLSVVKPLSEVVCIGISQSGTTLETVMLMDTLRERFDTAALDYKEHFVWLTDVGSQKSGTRYGEAIVRSHQVHDWSDVDVLPLTVDGHCDINAIFCAPHSSVLFLSLYILLEKDSHALQSTYHHYLTLKDGAIRSILSKSLTVALHSIGNIQLILDRTVASPVTRLATQLVEQGLGSKQANFNPRVYVSSDGRVEGFEPVVLPTFDEAPPVVKMMLAMYSISVFVAMVAHHRRINFVTHPGVNLYKQRGVELSKSEVTKEGGFRTPEQIVADLTVYLNNSPEVKFMDVIHFGHLSPSLRQDMEGRLTSSPSFVSQGVSVNILPGDEWNHSRYQAALQNGRLAIAVLMVHRKNSSFRTEDISPEVIKNNAKMLGAIARATYETLRPRATYFEIEDEDE